MTSVIEVGRGVGGPTLMTKLFSFNGRIRRLDFWLIRLGVIGVLVAAAALLVVIVAMTDTPGQTEPSDTTVSMILLVGFAVFIPLFWIDAACCVKRLHDQNLTGWLFLISIVPLGSLVLLILCGFIDGTPGPNPHGQTPKGIGTPAQTYSEVFT